MTWLRDNPSGLSFIVLAGTREVVIPRSLVEYRRKWKDPKRDVVEFTLPDWKIKQENLTEYVI